MAGFGVATKTITWFLDFCVLSFLQYLPRYFINHFGKKKASENPTIAEALPYFSFRFIVLKSSAKFNRTRFGRSPKSNLANMTGTLGEVVKGEGPKSEAQAAILARNLIKNSRPCCGTNERLERYGASERPDQVGASSRADQPDLRPRADHVSLELV